MSSGNRRRREAAAPQRPVHVCSRCHGPDWWVRSIAGALYLQGKLTPEQAAFFAPRKPAAELYDLRVDPHEVHNVADDPKYAGVEARLLAELDNWRKRVIDDRGVSDDFPVVGVFPPACPPPTVDARVEADAGKCDFNKYGWPAWYPTRTLEEWKKARALWQPYAFRGPAENMPRPSIAHSRRRKRSTPDSLTQAAPTPPGASESNRIRIGVRRQSTRAPDGR
ncbi:MAG TPA: hypothetical protein EYP56_22625 [Planctomycetaceae bacterium]|nr:hypothetical protein [Planctomycetaceae bacterium]